MLNWLKVLHRTILGKILNSGIVLSILSSEKLWIVSFYCTIILALWIGTICKVTGLMIANSIKTISVSGLTTARAVISLVEIKW